MLADTEPEAELEVLVLNPSEEAVSTIVASI